MFIIKNIPNEFFEPVMTITICLITSATKKTQVNSALSSQIHDRIHVWETYNRYVLNMGKNYALVRYNELCSFHSPLCMISR